MIALNEYIGEPFISLGSKLKLIYMMPMHHTSWALLILCHAELIEKPMVINTILQDASSCGNVI